MNGASFVKITSMNHLQLISIFLEAVIAILFFLSALREKKYLYGLTFTFAVYVFYDLNNMFGFAVSPQSVSYLFFAATLTAFWSAQGVYRK